jgi:hypothetical protein
MQAPTHEQLGIAYAPERVDLCEAVDAVIDAFAPRRYAREAASSLAGHQRVGIANQSKANTLRTAR